MRRSLLVVVVLVGFARGLRLALQGLPRCCVPRMCDAHPPSLKGAERFQRGTIATSEHIMAWWRQDPQKVQVIVALPEEQFDPLKVQRALTGLTSIDARGLMKLKRA